MMAVSSRALRGNLSRNHLQLGALCRAPFSTGSGDASSRLDLDHAIAAVREYDPSGYLPGRLLPEKKMQLAYFAVRSFWVETGLRMQTTAKVPPNASPSEHLEWWSKGVDILFDDRNNTTEFPEDWDHPTFRLLGSLLQQGVPWRKGRFDEILDGRREDLVITQYETLDQLVRHAEQSCGGLSELVMESGGLMCETNPVAHQAARKVGICHGLTNALRLSLPIMSTTRRLIVPKDLTSKYGVKSPRYLLSALGQGDDQCVRALQETVEHMVTEARKNLGEARELKETMLAEPNGSKAVSVLLPAVASETFLNRLERANYKLTDRDLRSVNAVEHVICALRIILNHVRKTY